MHKHPLNMQKKCYFSPPEMIVVNVKRTLVCTLFGNSIVLTFLMFLSLVIYSSKECVPQTPAACTRYHVNASSAVRFILSSSTSPWGMQARGNWATLNSEQPLMAARIHDNCPFVLRHSTMYRQSRGNGSRVAWEQYIQTFTFSKNNITMQT